MTRAESGELAIVLHTHMPYVEGHGTWPFGEEWLWEATATSYLPLLEVLEELGTERSRRELTLSMTPVLCDQLALAEAMARCVEFLTTVRPESHRLEIEAFTAAREGRAVGELERSAAEYARAAAKLAELQSRAGDGLLQALGRHATWTSSATHAILPLLMLDEALELQLNSGIESFRRRFGEWQGGFWLPECAHTPGLGHHLTEAGVHCTCVELTEAFGAGDMRHLQPRQGDEGPVCWPLDRVTIDLVWGADGYPSRAPYRDSHHLTTYHHRVWANDGSIYDHERALRQARADAAEFVAAVKRRLADGGVCVFAIDTELLGHWWYEGPRWLAAVIAEADRQGLPLTTLDDAAAERHPPVQENLPDGVLATSWGAGNDLRTWSGPQVADYVWQMRTAEIDVFMGERAPSERALRELLALQASDWAFLQTRGWAGDYPRERFAAHAAALRAELASPAPGTAPGRSARGLAPWLVRG